MKKYAIVANIGEWEMNKGQRIIHCTVNDVELIADNDDRMALVQMMQEKFGTVWGGTEYKDNGKWYSYSIQMRKHARQELKRYGKL